MLLEAYLSKIDPSKVGIIPEDDGFKVGAGVDVCLVTVR